ncbi:MAG: hypothetical protein ACN4GZ_03410 [Acidimicrobiales bacterium]
MPLHDLIVRAGLVVDGQGAAPQTADIAVRDGHIAEIGRVRERAHRVVDADGALVIPGLVAFLPPEHVAEFDRNRQHHLAPGVTSTVERLPPSIAIEEVPRFLDTSADGPFLVNRSFLLSHDTLRQRVMGNKVRDQLSPSAGDIDQMADLLADGLLAGAVGLISALNGEPDELRALIREGVQTCSRRAEIDTATTIVIDAPERDSEELMELGRYLGNSEGVADVVVTTNEVLDDDKLISALGLQPAGTALSELLRHGTVIAGSNLNPLALLHAADPTAFPVQTVALRWVDTARSFGLNDRGAIAVDRCADLNVLDFVHLNEDLSDGVVSTLVAGEEIVSFNELTGATPGRIVSRSSAQPD